MNTRLECRRNDVEPKCCTCGYWLANGTASSAECGYHRVKVLDLSVCSRWRGKGEQELAEAADWEDVERRED